MNLFTTTTALLLLATLLLFAGLALRIRLRQGPDRDKSRETLDTVNDWPPEGARVLTIDERQAYDLLRRAMPGFLILAQVPLARFVRVPARHSYVDWLQRVGSLSADLMLCDSGSRVLAVIDIRAVEESARGQRRHERMNRVLTAAGIRVHTWREGHLPSLAEVRHALTPLVGSALAQSRPLTSRPTRGIPVAEMTELLEAGDRAAVESTLDPSMEPVASAFFDEMEPVSATRR